MRFFDEGELAEVWRALALAEELCGDHFKLASFDLRSAPYDVLCARELVDLGMSPPPEQTQLAEVWRCDLTREERPATMRRRTHYRIALWDPHILALRDQGVPLRPLLVYVLEHELVHVVRFAKRLARFESGPQERAREEALVHSITLELLERSREPGLELVRARVPRIEGCLARR